MICSKFASVLAIAALLFAFTTQAAEEFESLSDPQKQARYAAMIQEVRCLTCLNRSIAESETPLANDLRREIRELIEGGSSNQEVVDFLTTRYGDFIMYRPPVRPRTWALWAGPVVFLGLGTLMFIAIVRRRQSQPFDDFDDDEESDDDNFSGRDA